MLPNRISATVAFMLSALLISASAQPQRTHDIQPDDYFSLAHIRDVAVSPDGEFVAYTEVRWDSLLDRTTSDLWVVATTDKSRRRLTYDPANDTAAQWSQDSRHLYFLSKRSVAQPESGVEIAPKQVWRISREGIGLQQITRAREGVSQVELAKDGSRLLFTTSEPEYAGEWPALHKQYSHLEYGRGKVNFSQLHMLDLSSWRSRKLVAARQVIVDFAVAPDGNRIAMITRPDNTLLKNEGWSRVEVYDVASEATSVLTEQGWRDSHPSPFGWLAGLCWSEDSQALAFTIGFDGYPAEIYVGEWAGGSISLRALQGPEDITLQSGSLQWGAGRELCFLGQKQARRRAYSLSQVRDGRHTSLRELTPGDVVVSGFSLAGNKLVASKSTVATAADLFLVNKRGEYQRLTEINPQVASWKLPRISIVKWAGANSDTVAGILELPAGHKSGEPLPTIVQIHGGPTSASLHRFELSTGGRGLLPGQGYALFSPNYRGSTGYGDRFMTELMGRENDIEVDDILTGVDALVARGIADPERLGVMGWSNGGFLTNCLIARTTRFKAASSGAGVIDQLMQWGLEDTPGHVINFMQGQPWSKANAYRAASPLYSLGKTTTPTLIHVGGADERVPAAHARTLYRALNHYLRVDTELVVYPGEPHGLSKYRNRKAKMAWDLAWFDKYLLRPEAEMSMGQAW